MPVTFQVAKHEARPVGYAKIEHEGSQDVLQKLIHSPAQSQPDSKIGPILTTSLGQQTSLTDAKLKEMKLSVQDHGLIRAAYYAYSFHHNLVLRPEDIWFAILTQFSFYVNANAEKLRSSFVTHEGKKGLILRDPGQNDMGLMCRNMTKLIDQNIIDKELRKWILPSFTTTTVNDEVVAAVIMMGTLQRYFEYIFDCTCCGIPYVTLLGELSDWEDIQRRIEKLSEYGEEPARFCEMLRPILQYMILSFKTPEDPGVVDFWSKIIHHNSGSGMDSLDGWMVAFCFWDEKGKCLVKEPRYLEHGRSDTNRLPKIPFHTVEFADVPCAFVSCPVTYISPDGGVISTKLLAGHAGFELIRVLDYGQTNVEGESNKAASDDKKKEKKKGILSRFFSKKKATETLARKVDQEATKISSNMVTSLDNPNTVRPVTGWWMYKDEDGKDTGKSRSEFYQGKMANDWNGKVSTGYVQKDGETVIVKEELPSDL